MGRDYLQIIEPTIKLDKNANADLNFYDRLF